MNIQKKLVKNFTVGRNGGSIQQIAAHRAQGSESAAYAWFNNTASKASSNYFIANNGDTFLYVEEANTAWANGLLLKPDTSNPYIKDYVAKKRNPNNYVISVEFEGMSNTPFTTDQMASFIQLSADIIRMYPVLLATWNKTPGARRWLIVGHYQFDSVNKKNCPGQNFPFDAIVTEIDKIINPPVIVLIDPKDEQIKNLQQTITDKTNENLLLQGQVVGLKNQVNTFSGQINVLELDINQKTGLIDTLTVQKNGLELEVKNLTGQLGNVNNEDYQKSIFYKMYLFFKNK